MDWEYKEQTIRVNPDGRFTIEWTEDVTEYGKDERFFTKDEADRAINEALALKAKNISVHYAILRRDGISATITGINRNTSRATMNPDDIVRFSRLDEAFPDLPVVKKLLDKIINLEKEIDELNIPLGKIRINLYLGGGRITPENYSNQLAVLSDRVDQAYKKAQEMDQNQAT